MSIALLGLSGLEARARGLEGLIGALLFLRLILGLIESIGFSGEVGRAVGTGVDLADEIALSDLVGSFGTSSAFLAASALACTVCCVVER